jgi:hypothetical protein
MWCGNRPYGYQGSRPETPEDRAQVLLSYLRDDEEIDGNAIPERDRQALDLAVRLGWAQRNGRWYWRTPAPLPPSKPWF